jgi:hypothetical protein
MAARQMEEEMHLKSLVVSVALALFATAGTHAQDAERYRLEKSADGFVRMDTQTGAMSICQEQSGQLVCKMAADERRAFQDEVERLQGEVKSLDGRVTKLENSLTARMESKLPTEEEFDKTMSYMERFFRRFMGIAKELEKEDQGNAGKPAPDRT